MMKKQKPRKSKRKDTEAPQPSGPTTNVADEAFTEENVYKHSNDPLLSGEDSMKLEELMELWRHDDDLMFDTSVLNDEEVFVGHDMAEKKVSTVDIVTTAGEVVTTANVELSTASPTDATITTVELTLAQTLAELKSARPKTKWVVMQDPSESITTTTTTIPSKDKGKGLMIETDYEIVQRLQAEEQKELTIEENSKLFVQLLEARKKHFAAKRAKAKRNRPPTKAQQRSIMCTYLKNMAGWKPKDLKNNETKEESSSKRAGEALEQESSKKQKLEEDKESEELKQCLEIIPDDGDDVTIDDTPLSTKSLTIVDYKIYKEGKKSYFQIIIADGNSQMYLTFGKMLKNFDREDLDVLWSIVKARFKMTEPVNYMVTFLKSLI
ncbi:hypothetical protein Tco_0546782 [Tanacetum coccineum]